MEPTAPPLHAPTEHFFAIRFTLTAPFLSHAAGASGFGIDSAMLRYGNKAALPGSLIRGNIRHALLHFVNYLQQEDKIAEAEKLRTLLSDFFGAPSESHSDFEAQRAKACFNAFFVSNVDIQSDTPRYRIQIDEETGRVEEGMLNVIESVFAPGTEVVFSGGLWVENSEHAELAQLKHWLEKSLQFIPALGSYKGVGFGKLSHVNVALTAAPPRENHQSNKGTASRQYFALHIDRPFCIAKPHGANGNRFEAETIIPGSVLKGIVARRFKLGSKGNAEDTAWQQAFDQLHFSHAVAIEKNTPIRGQHLPNSLVIVEGKERCQALDIIAKDPKALSEDPLIDGCAPAFATDWKDKHFALAQRCLNSQIPSPGKSLKISTAINRHSGAAEDENLFSMELVEPGDLLWQFSIAVPKNLQDSSEIKACQALLNAVTNALLGYGLNALGKTKARATVTALDWQQNTEVKCTVATGKHVFLTLQSHARIIDDEHTIPGTGGEAELKAAYNTYFTQASDGALKLSHYYASQQVVGGEYLHRTFGSNHYHPIWLTEAGSIFALHIVDAQKAKAVLKEWQHLGLPARTSELGHWQRNPYIRENGYGEITLRDQALSPVTEAEVEEAK